VDTMKDTARSAHDQEHGQGDHPHACMNGVVYVGHLIAGDDGEEVEAYEAVACRRCADR
jgi:hypothetical protein